MPLDGSHLPDDVDVLLSPSTVRENDNLRQAILQRTTRIVRRRRSVRNGLWLAAMVVCYAAGATTMHFVAQHDGQAPQPVVQREPPASQVLPRPAASVAERPHAAPSEPALSPYERLRRYSDRVLNQKGDIALATRCYARALDQASAEERAISVDDSWLLMALKADRFREKTHENHRS